MKVGNSRFPLIQSHSRERIVPSAVILLFGTPLSHIWINNIKYSAQIWVSFAWDQQVFSISTAFMVNIPTSKILYEDLQACLIQTKDRLFVTKRFCYVAM